MKFIKQFLIILLMSVLGGCLNWLIPLPIPATVWGMLLLFAALACGLIRLDQVENTADFFLSIMPMLFIPYAVGLMDSYRILAEHALPILAITVHPATPPISSAMAVAIGVVTDFGERLA